MQIFQLELGLRTRLLLSTLVKTKESKGNGESPQEEWDEKGQNGTFDDCQTEEAPQMDSFHWRFKAPSEQVEQKVLPGCRVELFRGAVHRQPKAESEAAEPNGQRAENGGHLSNHMWDGQWMRVFFDSNSQTNASNHPNETHRSDGDQQLGAEEPNWPIADQTGTVEQDAEQLNHVQRQDQRLHVDQSAHATVFG